MFFYESIVILINDYEFFVVAKYKDVSPFVPSGLMGGTTSHSHTEIIQSLEIFCDNPVTTPTPTPTAATTNSKLACK